MSSSTHETRILVYIQNKRNVINCFCILVFFSTNVKRKSRMQEFLKSVFLLKNKKFNLQYEYSHLLLEFLFLMLIYDLGIVYS